LKSYSFWKQLYTHKHNMYEIILQFSESLLYRFESLILN
jgi:hypothetical protein